MGCSSSKSVSVKQPRHSTTSTQRRTSSTEFREEKIYALLNRQISGQTTSLDDEVNHHRENSYEVEGTYQKCRNVYAAPLQNVEDFVPPVFPKSDEAVKFLKKVVCATSKRSSFFFSIDKSYMCPSWMMLTSYFLRLEIIFKKCSENFIFSGLTTEEKMLIINAMYPQTFESNTVIIQQGDIGDYFYVVEKGRVQFFINNKLVREGSDGVSFGELALLHNAPRSATVVALTECFTYRVDQHTFRTLLANNNVQRGKRCVELLKRVSIFKGLDTKVLIKIASAMTEILVRDEQYIIHKGDIGKIFYIIQEGNVKITDMGLSNETTSSIVQVLKPGDFFGERALITGETRSANAIAVGDCTLLCISKETVEAVVGSLEDLINDTCNKRILMCQSIFANAHLQPSEWDLLSNKMVKVTQSKGSILLEEGKPISNEQKGLYLIRKGEITVSSTNGDEYQQFWRGDSFGEDLIFSESSMVSSSTAIVDDDVTYFFLSQEDILAALGGIGRVQPPSLRKYSMDVDLTLNQLDKIKILGSGTYGQVWLAIDKRTKAAYAMKILDKRDIIQRSLEENVVRERKLMGSLNHPFIIKLMNSFQDKKNLFMVMEFVQGGELFDVLHKKNSHGISECSARFYAANIYDGLMHLHERQILYRDLKPEVKRLSFFVLLLYLYSISFLNLVSNYFIVYRIYSLIRMATASLLTWVLRKLLPIRHILFAVHHCILLLKLFLVEGMIGRWTTGPSELLYLK